MKLIKMEADLIIELENLYISTAEKLRLSELNLRGHITNFHNLLPEEFNRYIKLASELIVGIDEDVSDMSWRRKWIERADSSLDFMDGDSNKAEQLTSKFKHLSDDALLNKLTSATLLPSDEIPKNYKISVETDSAENNSGNNSEISDQDLSDLLYELARRSLIGSGINNDLMEKITKQLTIQKLDSLLWRIYFDIKDSGSQASQQHLLPLSILLTDPKLTDFLTHYLLPQEDSSNYNSYTKMIFLGMLVGTANFSPKFLTNSWTHLLDKRNKSDVSRALAEADIQGDDPLLEKIRNPTKTIFNQLDGKFESYREFFTSPALSWIEIDVDLLKNLGVDFNEFFNDGMREMKKASIENPEVRAELSGALSTLGSFMYRNYPELAKSERYTTVAAELLSLYIPDIRNMATQATIPLLAPILSDPEAMVIFSGSIGIYTLHHLKKALEVELNPNLNSDEKRRLSIAHADAVSDIHYHLFSAISLDEDNYNESATTFFEALKFTTQTLLPLLSLPTVYSKLVSTSVVFGTKKINNHIIGETIRQLELGEKLSPTEFFSRQIMNREHTQIGNSYPEPTWFEVELAKLILEGKPEARADLKIGKWFDGEKINPPNANPEIGQSLTTEGASYLYPNERNRQILSDTSNLIDEINSRADSPISEIEDFSKWFAESVNADPPTEFSSIFTYTQREFGRDILLDALSVEIEGIKREARLARATAELALESYYQNLRMEYDTNL